MSMKESIETIKKKFRTSGSSPVLVLCDDLEYYVCKYDNTLKLFNELVGASFLQLWNIPVPPFSVVNILSEHVPEEMLSSRFNLQMLSKPCFGSKFLDYAQDLTEVFKVFDNDSYALSKIINPHDLLKIALFDIWVANNDRNIHNHNLLLQAEEEGYIIVPIDHSDIFDGNNLTRPFAPLTFQDSILSSAMASTILSNKKKTIEAIKTLQKEFYLYNDRCGKHVDNILNNLPKEWGLDKGSKAEQIRTLVVDNPNWLKVCEDTFLQHAHELTR